MRYFDFNNPNPNVQIISSKCTITVSMALNESNIGPKQECFLVNRDTKGGVVEFKLHHTSQKMPLPLSYYLNSKSEKGV